MRRLTASCFCVLIFAAWVVCQQTQPKEPPDPYKPVLDRLQSLTTVELPDWRFHADLPHPEDPDVSDSDWQVVKKGEQWESGPRVLRRWIEVPEKVGGYPTQGSSVELTITIRSKDSIVLTVFSNGGIVYRGDEDMQQPIPLTHNAQPGQKFLVVVRIVSGNVQTGISESKLSSKPSVSRPDPSLLRMEILS